MKPYGTPIALLLLAGCEPAGNLQTAPPANSADRVVKIEVPIGLPPIPFPPGSPPMEAAIELGRRLFYDKNLSLDGSVACWGLNRAGELGDSATINRAASLHCDGRQAVDSWLKYTSVP